MADFKGTFAEELSRELDKSTRRVPGLGRHEFTLAFESDDQRLEEEAFVGSWCFTKQTHWWGEGNSDLARQRIC